MSGVPSLRVFVLLFFCLTYSIGAQTDPLYEDWRWVPFTTDSGLPSNNVIDVFETTTGVMWVRTAKGLAWYDNFRWWPVGIEQGLPSSPVIGAVPGLNGEILVVIESRFYRGHQDVFEFVPLVVGGDTLDVTQVIPLDERRELILTDSGLFQLDANGVAPLSSLPQSSLMTKKRQVVRTKSGRIWSLSSAGLHEWVGEQWVARVTGHGLMDIAEDDFGGLVFSEHSPVQQGIWIWAPDGEPKLKAETSAGLVVTAMHVAPDGDIVVGYTSGQVEVRRDGIWHDLVPVPRWMLGVQCLRFGRNGDLWVGGDEGLFLFRASSQRWHRFAQPKDGPKELIVGELLQLENGDLWVGTVGGVLVYHRDGSDERFNTVLGTSIESITGMAKDAQGGIWLSSGGSFTGAYRWHENVWQHYGQEDGLLATNYHRIMSDRQGRLWFLGLAKIDGETGSDSEKGAFVYDGEGFTQWGTDEGLLHGRVYAMAEGADGALWFGTLGGVSRWFEGKWTHWTTEQGLRNDRVFTLTIDQEGTVWFGHGYNFSHGLGYLDAQGKPHYLTVVDGLINNQVFEVTSAPDGSIWVGLWGGGITRYKDGIFSSFGRAVGLGNLGLWPVLPLGDRVYIGTSAGVYELSMKESDNPPPMVQYVPPVIDGDRVVIRWQAYAFEGEVPEGKVETRYQLDDGPWSHWSTLREATYLGLRSGSHQIVVQAKSLFGNVNADGEKMMFRIAPPLYQHPLVVGILCVWGISMIVLGGSYWKRQRRFLREIGDRNVELESEIIVRNQMEEKLRDSEEMFRQLLECVPYGIVLVNKEGIIRLINAQTETLFGYDRDELLGKNVDVLMPENFRSAHLSHMENYYKNPTQRTVGANLSLAGLRKNGQLFPVDISLGPVKIENEVLLIGIIVDVTDRQKLEEQFRQSQKMEAVGKLAGGVAHDFNNILTVINGYSDMLLEQVEDSETRDKLGQISRAGVRAAALTRQLLAFSRKQMLQPKVLDINVVLADTSKLLQRLIGEDIELTTVFGNIGKIEADPGQLEQVFMNLAVNARDAMPQGGSIHIRTAQEDIDIPVTFQDEEMPAGSYVVILISDTGVGMDKETQARIFEPFFTTKDVGKGTGLGLSTVYGIVKQSGGFIFVHSEVGSGTTFKLYFNRFESVANANDEVPVAQASYRGDETILLVEDESAVLDYVRQVLTINGYTVLDSNSGEKAFDICKEHDGQIHLLLTDVVMPRMSGREVAEQLMSAYPELKVLYMSGYTDDALLQHGVVSEEIAFLYKPFTPDEVLKKVRMVLDA